MAKNRKTIKSEFSSSNVEIKDIISLDEESANEQKDLEQTINLIGQNYTQLSKHSRVF